MPNFPRSKTTVRGLTPVLATRLTLVEPRRPICAIPFRPICASG